MFATAIAQYYDTTSLDVVKAAGPGVVIMAFGFDWSSIYQIPYFNAPQQYSASYNPSQMAMTAGGYYMVGDPYDPAFNDYKIVALRLDVGVEEQHDRRCGVGEFEHQFLSERRLQEHQHDAGRGREPQHDLRRDDSAELYFYVDLNLTQTLHSTVSNTVTEKPLPYHTYVLLNLDEKSGNTSFINQDVTIAIPWKNPRNSGPLVTQGPWWKRDFGELQSQSATIDAI